jgi:hypothetical protein
LLKRHYKKQPDITMRRRGLSQFTGVFTLKTHEQVQQLSAAVKHLVENSIEIFNFLETGKTAEVTQLIQDLDTITRLSAEFVDLTLDAEERSKAQDVVSCMGKATEGLKAAIIAYSKHKKANSE